MTPDGALNLLLCTVKENGEKSFCFEVISPDEHFHLRATNETEYRYLLALLLQLLSNLTLIHVTFAIFREWLEVLRDGIALQLANNDCPLDNHSSCVLSRSQNNGNQSLTVEMWAVEGNDKCADCKSKG